MLSYQRVLLVYMGNGAHRRLDYTRYVTDSYSNICLTKGLSYNVIA